MDADGGLEPVASPELKPLVRGGDVEAGDEDALDTGLDGSRKDLVAVVLEGLGLDVGMGVDEP